MMKKERNHKKKLEKEEMKLRNDWMQEEKE